MCGGNVAGARSQAQEAGGEDGGELLKDFLDGKSVGGLLNMHG
jgi:hypothetical protein